MKEGAESCSATISGTAGICVIVPVFGAADDLARCLASLAVTIRTPDRVLLADDASQDREVHNLLDAFRSEAGFEVHIQRRRENLGFIGNVNLAFAEADPADVVLLNSDTIVTPGWLDRLRHCAASDPTIATITPWSNNAEICSLPEFCRPTPVPEEVSRWSRAAVAAGAPTYPDLPTAVGFCMYIRRAALRALGDFDAATFGRGYGEENDFCLRAAGHGWRNVLCDDAFVAHRGGASFSAEGHRPGGENLLRLNARYPDYNRRVADFIMQDPLRALRDRLLRQLDQDGEQPAEPVTAQGVLFQ